MINFRFVPTGLDEDSWGWELDRTWAPLFNPQADRAFYADVFRMPSDDEVGREDVGICHSVLLPGESYAWRLAHLSAAEIMTIEHETIRKFRRVYTLSKYFHNVLSSCGLKNVAGVIRYPPPVIEPAHEIQRRVIIAQRLSEEKLPLLVLELARRMPDMAFVFVHAREPEGLYRIWIDSATPNVSFQCFRSRAEYYRFLAQSGCGLVATVRDNFGVSGLECLAAGRPYVAPDAFAYRELVSDANCLYEPFSLSSMERAVRYASSLTKGCGLPWSRSDAVAHLTRKLV